MLDRLPETTSVSAQSSPLENAVRKEHTRSKKVMKSFMNNAGILVGVFIVFAVIVIVTTDIRLVSLEELSSLGLDFFLLLFCSYSMYITCSDSGMRAGLAGEGIKTANLEYEKQKRYLMENGLQGGLYAFCRDYVQRELENERMSILVVVGFTYDEYKEKWMNADEETILASELSEAQKKAIIKVNKIKPITLSPELIMRKGRNDGARSPLGIAPQTKKKLRFGVKFVTTLFVSLGIAGIALEVVKDPSLAIFASVMLKLLTIVINGFSGYKFGLENIVIDTVSYIEDQTDLLKQAIRFIESKSQVCTPNHEGGNDECASVTSELKSVT